jgi:hypothetical protein
MITLAAREGYPNQYSMTKTGAERPSYILDFTEMLPGTNALSTGVTVALDSTGATVTTNCVSSSTISGNQITVLMLTCGSSSGTLPAADGSRFRLRTTATLSSGAVYNYDVFILVKDPTYSPIPV